jgi:CDP-diglyceride synthetase
MKLPVVKSTKQLVLFCLIAAVPLTLLYILVIGILSGGPEATLGVFDKSLTVLRPSVGKAAAMHASFWTYLGVWAGAVIFCFSIFASIEDRQFGNNEDVSFILTLLQFFGGILLMWVIYLTPAYDLQRYTTITVPTERAKTIKDRDFKEPYTNVNPDLFYKSFDVKPPTL